MSSESKGSVQRVVLIGHRGSGKSSLLRRIESYYQHDGRRVQCLDLDREIEKRSGRPIHAIFAEDGEETFRKIERETFRGIEEAIAGEASDIYLSCGAGFDPALIPSQWKAIWVRRPTDVKGRIFLDRPRLNPRVPALEEFNERYHRRHSAYAARADEIIWIDEGIDSPDEAEAGYFLNEWRGLEGAITVLPARFRTDESFKAWISRRLRWGVRWFELRDDLLSQEQMDLAIGLLPDEKILVSFRSPARQAATEEIVTKHALAFDWPLERGLCEFSEPRFLSLHERLPGQSVTEALNRFPLEITENTQLKAALPIENFKELMEAHAWHEALPEARIFLPMSQDGRWTWYRLRQGTGLGLNFFKEDEGTGADQPTLLQWARRRRSENDPLSKNQARFAAVLGNPVAHSRTPLEQAGFFARYGAPVFAVRVTEQEWAEGAVESLRQLGLRWAAVTSPLKTLAFELSKSREPLAEELRAVNTLTWSEDDRTWKGTNTDLDGFRAAVEEAIRTLGLSGSLGAIAVWGGGGTLNVIKSVLPDAELFSLRTGENREAGRVRASEFKPDTVIWAPGRGKEEAPSPPENWKPRLVIDLNYTEDSPGRTYALSRGSRYFSGLAMFKSQAEAQRQFWND